LQHCNTIAQVFRRTSAYTVYIRSFDGLWGFVTGSDSISPSDLTPGEVDERIEKLIGGGLEHYDGVTHQGMFSLPKGIRKQLAEERRVARDDNPVYMPA